jgi:uncharacterized protein YdaU (DUF1376 family)
MAKDPVLPLYYNDITTSTQDWTDEEFGAYMRLLIHQWRQGGLPKDHQRLARIATSLDTNWSMLKVKFEEVDGMLKNPVMEIIREKRARHKEKQSENAQKRYQKSAKDDPKLMPLEGEKEKEKEKVIGDQGVQGEPEPLSDAWFEECFDSLNMEKIRTVFPKHNIANELLVFKLKARASPKDYMHRDGGSIRKAFIYQLKNSKAENNVRKPSEGTPTTTIIDSRKDFGASQGFSRSGTNSGGS